MVDVVDSQTRSRMMSSIRGGNTRPELIVRKALFKRGFRYRLHVRELPGTPDLVFAKYRAVVFINGCFWHRHDCHLFKWPATRREFWEAKLNRNIAVDLEAFRQLKLLDWRVMVIWECAIKGRGKRSIDEVAERACRWLLHGYGDIEVKGKRVERTITESKR